LLSTLFARNTLAQEYKMIFWYPGEAGTTVDAQGAIGPFFDYINQRITPDKITGGYFNNVPEGAAYIKSSRPAFGIISFAAYAMNDKALGPNTKLLQTLPLPSGKPYENYVVVGKGKPPLDWDGAILHSKQPLTGEFISKFILNEKVANLKVERIHNILPTLKNISAGTLKGGAILQPMEYFTLKSISQPWAKELTVWTTSPPVPSAPIVAFGEQPATQKIKDILLKMGADPEAKEMLRTLRLKGFAQ